jgi:hypothetical protein
MLFYQIDLVFSIIHDSMARAEFKECTKFTEICVTVWKSGTKYIGKNLENVCLTFFGLKQNDKKFDLPMGHSTPTRPAMTPMVTDLSDYFLQ